MKGLQFALSCTGVDVLGLRTGLPTQLLRLLVQAMQSVCSVELLYTMVIVVDHCDPRHMM